MSTPLSDGNALEAAESRARISSDRTLAIALVAGIVGVSASFLSGHPKFALPFVTVAAFGAWGMIDHFARRNILRFSRDTRTFLRHIKKCVAAIGVTAAVASAFVFFGNVLGVIIS